MEAGWFQRTLGYFLLFGLSRGAMTDYMQRAESAIAGLHPALIYLHATDAERAYELARTCRPARWFAETNAWIASLPYGRGGRSGEEPLARFLRDARVLLDRFYARSRLRKIALDVSSAAWPATYETIGDFLSLPMVRSGAPSRSSLRKYEGCYVLRRRPEQMEIRLGRDGVLVASFESWLPLVRLLPVRAGVFLAAGFPVEMAFRVSRLGVVRSVALRVAPGQEIPGWSLLDKTFQRRV